MIISTNHQATALAIDNLRHCDLHSWFWFGHAYDLPAVLAHLDTVAPRMATVLRRAAELEAAPNSEAAILAEELDAQLRALFA